MFSKDSADTYSTSLTVEFNFSYINELSYGLASLFANNST